MKIFSLFKSGALLSTILLGACSNDDPSPGITIPIQTVVQSGISMGGTSSLALLAGESVTNTGATSINGDIGLSPGTSIDGFPPGEYTGTLHVNDAIANQAKLDLTTAYNDAAGRTSNDIGHNHIHVMSE